MTIKLEASAFDKCVSSDAVVATFQKLAMQERVRRCAIIAPLPFHASAGAATRFYSWGFHEQWVRDYRQAIDAQTDDIPDQIMEKGRPVLWEETKLNLRRGPKNSAITENFFRFHDDDGVSIPLFGPYGYQVLLSLSFDTRLDNIDDPRIAQITDIGRIAHRRYAELFRTETLPKWPLSAREQQVLLQMANGQSNKESARHLGISPNSIDTYQRRIYQKLQVADRTEAVVRGLSMGLIKL